MSSNPLLFLMNIGRFYKKAHLHLCRWADGLFCLVGLQLLGMDQVQGKSHKYHAAQDVADGDRNQVLYHKIDPVQVCQLFGREECVVDAAGDVSFIGGGEDAGGDVIHIGNTVLIAADTKARMGKKMAQTLPAISLAAMAMSTAMQTKMLHRMPEASAAPKERFTLPSATLMVKAPSRPFV